MPSEILRIVDAIHREKDIEKEIIFQGIEAALQAAARKRYRSPDDIAVKIDRDSGEIFVIDQDGSKLLPPDLGRIAAQAGKQAIIQKIREAERDVIYEEFYKKKRSIITGYVHRYENRSLIVNMGRAEGILPPQEQVQGENYQPGDRIRTYLLEVKRAAIESR